MARTVGERLSWGFLGALMAAAMVQPWGCDAPVSDRPVDAAIGDLLEDLWPEVVQPTLGRVRVEADALVAAVDAWVEATADGGDASVELAAARDAWFGTLEVWQEAEVMQIGPAGSSLDTVGGADLRDAIYSWPTVNRCRVDQETVRGGYDNPDFFQVNLVNTYGLDALETLLFTPGDTNHCPPQVDINSEGTFDALGPDGVARARAEYAAVVARGLVDRLQDLVEAWDPDGGDFAGQIARAGEADSPFTSRDQAVNAIFDGLFYMETGTKDRKLANPLGLRDCGGPSCQQDIESTLAGASHTWVVANIRGFRTLFLGGEGAGMDDLLRALGHDDVADAVVQALDEAEAVASGLDIPVDEALQGDPTPAVEVHDAVKAVTDLLKGDLATVLQMQIPQEAAGDND